MTDLVTGWTENCSIRNNASKWIEINPAELTRQITHIQTQLLNLAKAKTETLAAARHLDLEALQPAINRLAKAK